MDFLISTDFQQNFSFNKIPRKLDKIFYFFQNLSGQQVLGPNRRDLDSHLFNAIQRAGAERLTPEQIEALGRQQQQSGSNSSNRFSGGFRLGGNGVESGPVGGGNVAPPAAAATNVGNNSNRPSQQVVWKFFKILIREG